MSDEKLFLVHDETDIPYKNIEECPIELPSDEEEFEINFIRNIINS